MTIPVIYCGGVLTTARGDHLYGWYCVLCRKRVQKVVA